MDSLLHFFPLQSLSGWLLFITPELSTILIFLLLILLFISFCVSGAEVAFFSLSFKDINYLKTRSEAPFKRVISLLEQPKLLMASLLIANCVANIGIIIISSFLLDPLLPLPNAWLKLLAKLVLVSLIVLLPAEIVPKTYASQNNIRFAKDVSWLVEGIHLLFHRLAAILVKMSDTIETALGKRTKSVTREEMHAAIDLTTPQKEQDILKGILDFGDKTVKQVMISRLDVNGIGYHMSFAELKSKIEDLHYSRLPVYNGSLDEIKGMLHTKDLLPFLNESGDFDWHPLMRPAYFVHEQKFIKELMKEFQQKRIHFAVVVDEFGGTSGIITHEDILEEVIGEISDEFDEEESDNNKLDDTNYLFLGKTMLTDVCKTMNLSADTFDKVKGESDSLAGLILEVAGEIPAVNQVISVGDFDFTVLELFKNRIQKVKVTIKPQG